RQALKARRVETRKGLDAQLATRAEHAIAVSGQRPEMPLASLSWVLLCFPIWAPMTDTIQTR
ncbi:MAG: hypothetical protein RXS25_26010, partial [Paraburkholderia sp.]|uniref:hypothetical protein n=1 Tax=Paraburkholderia sp. TaxID=1926495 RepID=UPI00397D3CD1